MKNVLNNLKKFFKTDIKVINSYFLAVTILVILVSVGLTSYALFSYAKISNNVIEMKVGKIQDPNIEPQTFNYVEGTEYYTYIARANGYYNLDVYGAQGGSYNESYAAGGLGGYSTGIVKLNKGDILYVYVGGKGSYGTSTTVTVKNGGGYNGGGNVAYRGGAGGGASDIRYFSTTPTTDELKWNSEKGLNSRLIVAGGGGGAYAYNSSYKAAGGAGGGTTGGDGTYYSSSYPTFPGKGGTQTAGGSAGTAIVDRTHAYAGKAGTFGTGGDTGQTYSTSYYSNGAGGGGFYGGGAADNYASSTVTRASSGGGGSGYVWTSATASNYTTSTLPTSMYLTNAKTEQGTNLGNGKVIISYLGKKQKVVIQSKNSTINIDPSTDTEIKSYFNIYEVGSTLSSFVCSSNNASVTRTTDLYYGKNIVNCIATDSNNVTSNASITINITGTFAQTLLAADSSTPVKASSLESRIVAKGTPTFSVQEPSFTWNYTTPTKTNTYNLSTGYTSKYIIIADDFEFDKINNIYSLKGNVRSVLYNTDYASLIGKYSVSYYPNASSTTINTANYTNKYAIYKITNATYDSTTKQGVITYLSYNNRNSTPDTYDSSKSGMYSAQDNYGTSYYYRGDIKNNYVSFAGFYWRIIRINGNGSVRLLYAGKVSDVGSVALENGSRSSLLSISSLAFNTSVNNYYYVGLKYSTYSYHGYNTASNVLGTTSKTGSLYYWYYNNLQTNYSSYISDTLFCSNRDYEKDEYNDINYDADPANPKLVCNTKTDRFTKSDSTNGTATLTYPIGLITIDEIIMGGVGSSGSIERMYQKSYTVGPLAWTMTPCYYRQDSSNPSYNHSCVWIYGQSSNDMNNSDCNMPSEVLAVRPVINLIPNVTYTGTGTASDPYVITGIK